MTPLARLPREDRGSTLLVAMMVMGVALSLSLLVVSVAIGTGRTTGGDRQRLTAVNAAEAGVDAAYADIQSSGVALPCTWPATGPGVSVNTYPKPTMSRAEITYYNSSGAVIPCMTPPTPANPATVPVRASIRGTGTVGTASAETRVMEALVNLKPVVEEGLDKAMFGETLVGLSNNASVTAGPGLTADIYSNGDFLCDNSPIFHGSILAPKGKIVMKQSCEATGDVWALNSVVLEGNKTIGGRVLSATSTITADGNSKVNGTLIAKGAIAWNKCTSAKCLSDQSAVPVPPISPFPELRGDPATLAKWTAPAPGPGFTIVPIPSGTCGTAAGNWLKTQVALITTDTLYTTACHVKFDGTQNTDFNADVAVFAGQGVSTSNLVTLRSKTGAAHNVYFVQPYDAVASRPCTGNPVMGPSQNFSSTSDLTLLWYSPCDISYGNLGGSYGQVYSGSQLTTNNQYNLVFRKLPMYGLTNVVLPTTAYTVDVVYKRETN